MIRIQKKIVVDEHGAPKEPIIPWKQFCEIAEALGFDLDDEATADLRAARYFEPMDAKTKAQLVAKLERLASNPGEMSGVKPMAGEWAGFRRMWHRDLRVIYIHDRLADTIVVAHIGPRGDVYK